MTVAAAMLIAVLRLAGVQEAVLVLNPEEESVIGFVEELQRRLTPPPRAGKGMSISQSTPDLSHLGAGADGAATGNGLARSEAADLFSETDTPFELRALEVVLDVVSWRCPCC